MSISITPFSTPELDQTICLLKHNRESFFPLLPIQTLSEVQEAFENDFIEDPLGYFLLAKDRKNNLIATIGMRTYDNRFEQFCLAGQKVTEVVKLYVHPTFRKIGLGSLLFKTLEMEAHKRGIDELYLHTHRFLPGAIPFWERQGFSKIHDQGGQWQTVHFAKPLSTNTTLAKSFKSNNKLQV